MLIDPSRIPALKIFAAPAFPDERGFLLQSWVASDLEARAVGPSGAAPYRVGENTRSVLEGVLGYEQARIDELLALGAVAAP